MTRAREIFRAQDMRDTATYLEENFPPYSLAELKAERSTQWHFQQLTCPDFCFLEAGNPNSDKQALNIFRMTFGDMVFSGSNAERFKEQEFLLYSQSESRLLYP